MKKIHVIAALLAMLMPTLLWGTSTYYAKATVGITSDSPSGAGKVYGGSSSSPSDSSYWTTTKSAESTAEGDRNSSADVTINLSAKPTYGYSFAGWYGNADGSGSVERVPQMTP